ncbi:uncharacterized protein At4g04775-like [Brassica rapa]|uniref:uncharacterized protein At4g04775-like n=1 Tax=Brassica campestris TaxID=3711 RepID=UPI00142D6CAF|nr:uncharacterized protein At4g04775-like [Brassica rapa]
MSNVSGASSGSSSGRSGGRVFGVPRLCHCGVQIMELVSKSSNNLYRRYYRCGYAVSKKAYLDEIEALKMKNASLAAKLETVTMERNEFERIVFENVQMKLEKEIFERVEEALVESSSTMKKMMVVVVVLCMGMVGFSKLFG